MIIRAGIVLAAFTVAAAAQTAAPKLQPMKDERGKCQAAAPADASVILSHMAQGPNKSYSAVLEFEGGEKFEGPLSAADLAKFHYSKAFENTASRVWVEKEAHAVSEGYRAFHVYVPAKDGRCHLGISFKSTTSDDAPKRIAQTLSVVK
jgi:hypothetical protein